MCPHEEKITAWLLGDLPPSAQDEMTRHLERCAACRAARDELEGVLVPLRHGLERDRRSYGSCRTTRVPAALAFSAAPRR